MKFIVQYWWIIALQGLFLIGTGALAIFNPNIFVRELVQYLGLIFLVFGGIILATSSYLRRRIKRWWLLAAFGLLEAALGLIILASPNASSELFTRMIAIFAAFIGLVQLVIGLIQQRQRPFNLINAFISLAFAGLIYWNPFNDFNSLSYLVSFYSVIFGIMVIYYAFRLRAWGLARLRQLEEARKSSAGSDPKERPADPGAPSPL